MPEAETVSISSPATESARREPVGMPAPTAVLVRPPGRKTQKNLEIEQGEMKLLRTEMERRLKEQSLNREKKMDQLARRCENLEAGEAVQVLTILEDKHLGEVLKRMNREKALPIAALLERLGRGNAISLK
jgi:flagellar motility protein MotE (MotC chaperone)